jgi:hypothetical protein
MSEKKKKPKPILPYAKARGLITLSVPLTPDERERLRQAAFQLGISSTATVRKLIEDYC